MASVAVFYLLIGFCNAFYFSPLDQLLGSRWRSELSATPAAVEESFFVMSDDNAKWTNLCESFHVQPFGLTSLKTPTNGVRGVFVEASVSKGDILFSVPLDFIIVDSQYPEWFSSFDDKEGSSYFLESWVLRLASSLLSLSSFSDSKVSDRYKIWFELLPDANTLKTSLPVYWPEETLSQARCTGLELAVDSSYFPRAEAVEKLQECISAAAAPDVTAPVLDSHLQYMLDIVQTRTCRIESESSKLTRTICPGFDFINHSSKPNAEFSVENDFFLVRSLGPLEKGAEVLIDYGESTRPDWKCLASYGFVPSEEIDDSDIAEVYIAGLKYEVDPVSIPQDMIDALNTGSDKLTVETAKRVSNRLSDAACHLLLDIKASDDTDIDKEEMDELIPQKLAASLRWRQHRILIRCAKNLQAWADEQELSD